MCLITVCIKSMKKTMWKWNLATNIVSTVHSVLCNVLYYSTFLFYHKVNLFVAVSFNNNILTVIIQC